MPSGCRAIIQGNNNKGGYYMSDKEYIEICRACGKEYIAKRRGTKYCSKECNDNVHKAKMRAEHIRVIGQNTCIHCGETLPKNAKKFCSEKCRLEHSGINRSELTKKCPECGKEFKTYKSRKITCSPKCSKSRKNKTRTSEQDRQRYAAKHPDYISAEERHKMSLERKEKLEKDKAIRAKERAKKEKERQKILAEKEKIKQANIEYWQQYNEEHACVVCGKKYIAHHPFSKYCSDKCERKAHPRPKDRKRLRGKIIDNDITLTELAKKYNDICQICGLKVDWTDKQMVDGTTICGEYYPSIDHIKPISKGGLHSWDNVWLAHRKCNAFKSDKIMY